MLIMVKAPNRGDLTFAAGENLSYIGSLKIAVASETGIKQADFQLCKVDSPANSTRKFVWTHWCRTASLS
jgi:hypothetical protein